MRVAAVACGDVAAEQWGVAARKVDFHDLKGDLDSLAALSGAQPRIPDVAGRPGATRGVRPTSSVSMEAATT